MMSQTLKLALVLCLLIGLTKVLLPADVRADETQIKVPVVPQNLPPGNMVTGPPFQGIEIHVRGPAALLSTLPDLKVHYLLDLAGMQSGNHTVPVQIDRLNLPQGLSIVSIHPPSIQVHLESEARKDAAVIVFFKGNPAPGFFVAKITAVPDRVLLRGPRQVLDTHRKYLHLSHRCFRCLGIF